MKDNFQLLAAAVAFAILAWTFWHFLDSGSVGVISAAALLILVVDNIRLRRKLKMQHRR